MARRSRIAFTFDGGMAGNGQLNFYEAGRFLYGAARLVYIIERFRQTGIVIERITDKIDVDLRVGAPKKSSFLQEVFVVTAPIVAQHAFQVPLEAMFAHVWSMFGVANRNENEITEVARLQLERDKIELERDKERTKQLEIFKDVAQQGFTSNKVALELIGNLQSESTSINPKHLKEAYENLEAREKTAKLTKKYRQQLANITPDQELALTSRLRRPIDDMTLPLRGSAEELRIGFSANDNTCAYLNAETADWITQVKVDSRPTPLTVKVKNFDRENGSGKFRYDDMKRLLPFRLPRGTTRDIFEYIVDGLKKDVINVSGYFTRDRSGVPRSFLIDSILEEDAFS